MFTQAGIPVQDEKAFQELKSAIDAAFAPGQAERFLRALEKKGVRVRDFQAALSGKLLGKGEAQARYEAMASSDQAQVREYYLSRLEQVDPELRTKFRKIYAYY